MQVKEVQNSVKKKVVLQVCKEHTNKKVFTLIKTMEVRVFLQPKSWTNQPRQQDLIQLSHTVLWVRTTGCQETSHWTPTLQVARTLPATFRIQSQMPLRVLCRMQTNKILPTIDHIRAWDQEPICTRHKPLTKKVAWYIKDKVMTYRSCWIHKNYQSAEQEECKKN